MYFRETINVPEQFTIRLMDTSTYLRNVSGEKIDYPRATQWHDFLTTGSVRMRGARFTLRGPRFGEMLVGIVHWVSGAFTYDGQSAQFQEPHPPREVDRYSEAFLDELRDVL